MVIFKRYNCINLNLENLQINIILAEKKLPDFPNYEIFNTNPPLHAHYNYEFHYIYEGSAELELTNSKFIMEKGKVYLIPPCVCHEARNISDDFKRVIINFDFRENKHCQHECDKYTFYKTIYENLPPVTVIDSENDYFQKLINCIKEFDKYGKTDFDLYRAILTIIFDDITNHLNENGKNIPRPLSNMKSDEYSENINRAKRTEEYISNNIKNDITIESLANHLHLSVRHTKRLIDESMHISFKDFVRNYRMSMSKSLLQNADISLQEVADRVGYKSYTGFYNAFKNFTGMSPEEYQKNPDS